MHLIAVGLNHDSAPVALRERVALSERELPDALNRLYSLERIQEAAILSTCNRTELYVVVSSRFDVETVVLRDYLASLHDVPGEELDGHLYTYSDHDAVSHLMRVSAGLDSMMLGEYQILAQIKSAYAEAVRAGAAQAFLNPLFQGALAVGKRARTETEISRGAFSVGAAAVEFATRIFGASLKGQTVLVLGAGKTSELTARHLQARGAPAVFVTNRTYDRAVQLAAQIEGAQAIRFDELSQALTTADIVICSTASPHPVLTRELTVRAMRARRNKPLYVVDIAVPRDVEQSVGDLDNVFLYNIDDLQLLVDQAKSQRGEAVDRAQEIVAQAAKQFMERRQAQELTPLIVAVRERLESIRLDEMARLRARMPHLDDKEMAAMEQSLTSFGNKVAHDAIKAIREAAQTTPSHAYERMSAIRAAFGLTDEETK